MIKLSMDTPCHTHRTITKPCKLRTLQPKTDILFVDVDLRVVGQLLVVELQIACRWVAGPCKTSKDAPPHRIPKLRDEFTTGFGLLFTRSIKLLHDHEALLPRAGKEAEIETFYP